MSSRNSNVDCEIHELHVVLGRNGGECVLIDVRERSEYAGGRIPGSRLIPLGDIDRRLSELDPANTVYVVCRTGRRSAEAKVKLLDLGFSDVRNVRGGFESWRKAGFDVERDEHAPWSIERQVRFVAGALVLLGVLLSVLVATPLIWFSALVGGGLMFSAATDSCAMGTVLMRMPWNRIEDEGR